MVDQLAQHREQLVSPEIIQQPFRPLASLIAETVVSQPAPLRTSSAERQIYEVMQGLVDIEADDQEIEDYLIDRGGKLLGKKSNVAKSLLSEGMYPLMRREDLSDEHLGLLLNFCALLHNQRSITEDKDENVSIRAEKLLMGVVLQRRLGEYLLTHTPEQVEHFMQQTVHQMHEFGRIFHLDTESLLKKLSVEVWGASGAALVTVMGEKMSGEACEFAPTILDQWYGIDALGPTGVFQSKVKQTYPPGRTYPLAPIMSKGPNAAPVINVPIMDTNEMLGEELPYHFRIQSYRLEMEHQDDQLMDLRFGAIGYSSQAGRLTVSHPHSEAFDLRKEEILAKVPEIPTTIMEDLHFIFDDQNFMSEDLRVGFMTAFLAEKAASDLLMPPDHLQHVYYTCSGLFRTDDHSTPGVVEYAKQSTAIMQKLAAKQI